MILSINLTPERQTSKNPKIKIKFYSTNPLLKIEFWNYDESKFIEIKLKSSKLQLKRTESHKIESEKKKDIKNGESRTRL